MNKLVTLKDEMSSIRSYGFNIVWRNSNTVRYLRLNLFLGKSKYQFDFFRKDKYHES